MATINVISTISSFISIIYHKNVTLSSGFFNFLKSVFAVVRKPLLVDEMLCQFVKVILTCSHVVGVLQRPKQAASCIMVIASLGGCEVLLACGGDYVLDLTVLNHAII